MLMVHFWNIYNLKGKKKIVSLERQKLSNHHSDNQRESLVGTHPGFLLTS